MKWEYMTVRLSDNAIVCENKLLSAYGEIGWELVCVAPNGKGFMTAYFKRQKQ